MASTTSHNILLIGMVSHPPTEELTTDTSKRDQARVQVLRKQFGTVFTMNRDNVVHDKDHHVTAAMLRNGAISLTKLLNTDQHLLKTVDYICLDYVRCPAQYYHNFVTGNTDVAAGPIRSFVTTMQDAGKLSDSCKLMFACCRSSDRWTKSIKNLTAAFGQPPTYVAATENPLFIAGDATQLPK